jgi:hypothetical protein
MPVDIVCEMLKSQHKEMKQVAEGYREAERQMCYVTPNGFLSLIQLFRNLFERLSKESAARMDRFTKGLQQVTNTEDSVE